MPLALYTIYSGVMSDTGVDACLYLSHMSVCMNVLHSHRFLQVGICLFVRL